MKLGIIGQGFVGTAVREVMSNYYKVDTYDLDESRRSVNKLFFIIYIISFIKWCRT